MKIVALTLHGTNGWPEFDLDGLNPGLNVYHGPSASGKTTVADLVSHALYGQRIAKSDPPESIIGPEGELFVESRGRRFRLRRSHDETAGDRLTVAALDRSAVDQDTMRQLVSGMSPSLFRPLFSVSFREPPRLDWLLSEDYAREFTAALWRLNWAPPTIQPELRPIYARLRSLEMQVAAIGRALQTEVAALETAKSQSRIRNRRASRFLAQLTDGELVRLRLAKSAGGAHVVNRAGDSLQLDSLWSTQRDQVYLSLCLALASALGRHGVRLPLVLDEPFARLDARSSAALVNVLDSFSRNGHQVLVFTGDHEAAERFAALSAAMHDMKSLRERQVGEAKTQAADEPIERIRRRVKPTRVKRREAG